MKQATDWCGPRNISISKPGIQASRYQKMCPELIKMLARLRSNPEHQFFIPKAKSPKFSKCQQDKKVTKVLHLKLD